MSSRYTAYGIYQKLTYQEANAGSPMAYTGQAYQCQHSMRAYGFQFDAYQERTVYDAPNTTCCNQKVTPFGNKPQYKDQFQPMNPTDCQSGAAPVKCSILLVPAVPVTTGCATASGYASPREIKAECPFVCTDLVQLLTNKTMSGTYGDFKFTKQVVNTIYFNYTPRVTAISGLWEDCGGEVTLTETFCRTKTVKFKLSAGFDKPAGCYCNCCSGSQGYPVSSLSAPTIAAGWSNSVDPGSVTLDPSCSGGTITGHYSGSGGTSTVGWDTAPTYVASTNIRYYSGVAALTGGSGNSACCGGSITWAGTNGCGSGYALTRSWSRVAGAAGVLYSPASGTVFSEGSSRFIYGSGLCSYTTPNPIALSGYCMNSFTPGAITRGDGLIQQSTGTLNFSGTHACSGCCGKGMVTGYLTNGCGSAATGRNWNVRRSYTNNASGLVLRCWQYPISGWFPERAPYNCDGTSGFVFSGGLTGGFASLSLCNDEIATTKASGIDALRGACNLIGASGSNKCCRKWDNGLAHDNPNFRSYVFQASGGQCCAYGTTNGAWIFSGLSTCCPN